MQEDSRSVEKNSLIGIIKGILVGVILTLILVLLFSLIIKITSMSEGLIMPINQIIKVISIFIGVVVCIKDSCKQGLIKGIAVGLLITGINYLVFSVISKEWSFTLNTLLDILLGGAMGAISGIISVNFLKK